MTDDEFVAGLRAIFAAHDPADGIDRHDGFGSDVRITSLAVVDDGEFQELEIGYELDLSWRALIRRPSLRAVPRSAATRVLFGQDWRVASGFTSPSAYAPEIAQAVQLAAVQLVDEVMTRRRRRRVDPAEVERSIAGQDVLWSTFLADLRRDGTSVEEVSDGVVDVVQDWVDGSVTIHVHVTPSQWRELVVDSEVAARHDSGIDAARAGDGPALAMFHLDEEIGSLDEERHVVFFRGGFHPSIRAELPPVRAQARSWSSSAADDGDWYAVGPDDQA